MTPEPTPYRHRWRALGFLTFAALITALDASVMVVTTPTIQRQFDAPLTALEWTTSIYTLVYGATMLLWGRVGDIVTQRRMFVVGNVVFAAGSLLVGIAPTVELMVAMRTVQALGAAMVMPSTIALIADMFPGRERPVAYAINGASSSVGLALGYLAGGLAVQYADWRWAFVVNLGFCAVAVWGGLRYVPSVRARRRPELDRLGAALSLAGLLLLLFGLIEGQTYGWWWEQRPFHLLGVSLTLPLSVAPVALLAGVTVLVGFALVEVRRKRSGRVPLFDVTLFRGRSFRWSGLAIVLRSVSQFAVSYSLTLYLQEVEGFAALTAGLAAVPIAVAGILAAPLGAKVALRWGAQRSVLMGLVIQALGIVALWATVSEHTTLAATLLPNLVFGLGIGMSNSQLTVTFMQDVAPAENSDSAAGASTLRQVGNAVGAATVGIVLSTTAVQLAAHGRGAVEAGLDGFHRNMAFNLVLTVVAIGLATLIPDRQGRAAA